MMIDDDELRYTYKTASEEHLQNLDHYLLHLEHHPDDEGVIESALREAHSLKGDSNMLGVTDAGTLAHQLEHILGKLKRHEETLTADLSDRLSHALRALRSLVHEAVTGDPAGVDTFGVLATLMGVEAEKGGGREEKNGGARAYRGEKVTQQLEPSIPNSELKPQTSKLKPQSPSTPTETYRIESIRVATHHLDTLMNQAGELTVTKTRISHWLSQVESIAQLWEDWNRDLFNHRFCFNKKDDSSQSFQRLEGFHSRAEERLEKLGSLVSSLHSALYEDIARLETISEGLEEGIRNLRMLPLSTIFNPFQRLVRDLARQQGKQVKLIVEGGDTQADKRILEEMKDPLMHILRNAIDHGIEPSDERERLGKPATATIYLRGHRTPTSLLLEVSDDGRGLDLERIKQTALRRGLFQEDDLAAMTPSQIQALIFAPGFSTATIVTELSGRGVGLDVVRTNVEHLKGNIQVESEVGNGCTVRIQLGLTLATAHVLLVKVKDSVYAIPVEFVHTTCLVQPESIFTLEGRDTILREGEPITVAYLKDLLELSDASSEPVAAQRKQLFCIILQAGTEQLGIFVDALIDAQDVVIKPQSQLLKRVRNVSGATILGTGDICTILNPQDLMRSVQRQVKTTTLNTSVQKVPVKHCILLVEDSIATRTQERRILEAAGYEVVTAVDGLDGFNKLQSRAFDAVVSDVQMPNLDGLGLTAKIRQQREYNDIPVILVTSLASDEDKRRGAEAGADAYITKGSFNQQVLIETLQRLI